MGNSKYNKRFSDEYKAVVVDFYKTHSAVETIKEFNVSLSSIRTWCKKFGFIKGLSRFKIDFKHEVCQYYDNHTWFETCEEFGVSKDSLLNWRKQLGYRNKSRGYNLYMEGLQPSTQKSEYRKLRNDFVMTNLEKDNLKGYVTVLESKLKDVTFMLENLVKEIGERDDI
jgi:transposase-like protein